MLCRIWPPMEVLVAKNLTLLQQGGSVLVARELYPAFLARLAQRWRLACCCWSRRGCWVGRRPSVMSVGCFAFEGDTAQAPHIPNWASTCLSWFSVGENCIGVGSLRPSRCCRNPHIQFTPANVANCHVWWEL